MEHQIIDFNMNGIHRFFDKESLINLDYKIQESISGIYHDHEVWNVINEVLKTFKEDDIYIDAGACIGDTAMWIQKGTCFAFEPSERSYKDLVFNCSLNPMTKVIPIKAALYNKHINYSIKEGSHFGLDEIDFSKSTTAQTIILDEMFKNIPNIKFIKIDCEGADKQVLEGAIEIIRKNRPIIVIEINHSDKEGIRKIFEDLNYGVKEESISFIGRPK